MFLYGTVQKRKDLKKIIKYRKTATDNILGPLTESTRGTSRRTKRRPPATGTWPALSEASV